ncbi:MAG TPA: serine hydrolase [Acidisarcina sp.]
MQIRHAVVLLLSLGNLANSQAIPTDREIKRILDDRIYVAHQSVGIAVGLIDKLSARVITSGSAEDAGRPVTGHTEFEIGSVTKIFTSIILADMVQKGEVRLSDPVAQYLPPEVRMPERNGKKITLLDLATHTSGLPRMPSNFAPKDALNPYADYTAKSMFQFLSGYQLTRDPGEQYEYSNLGVGLLGFALARRAGTDYETLVFSRVCEPLGMSDTRIKLTSEMKAREATGHDSAMKPTSYWDIPTLAAAGALHSTVQDMLKLLSAELGFTKTPLAAAMASMVKDSRPTGAPDARIAIGWQLSTRDGQAIFWHNGSTGGFRSYLGFDPAYGIGVVAFSNANTNTGVDDLGFHLLDAKQPLAAAPTEHHEVAIDPNLLDGYVGVYTLNPGFSVQITRRGEQLYTQAPGVPDFALYAEGAREFFAKEVDLQIRFETDSHGKANGIVLRYDGTYERGSRAPDK